MHFRNISQGRKLSAIFILNKLARPHSMFYFMYANNWGAASSPKPPKEKCVRLTLAHFSSVGRAPTLEAEPSMLLDLESGTICRRTSDNRTCHTAVSDEHRRHLCLPSKTITRCESPLYTNTLEMLSEYLLNYILTYSLIHLLTYTV